MKSKFQYSFKKLKSYCESEDFKGWDPYDGMNSKVFQALPLKHWDLARLAWIQGFKRSPINFRKLLLVPKQHNSKGVAFCAYVVAIDRHSSGLLTMHRSRALRKTRKTGP